MKIDDRKNEDRDLEIPADFSHGDHGPMIVRVNFKPLRRFNNGNGLYGMRATVVVQCVKCEWKARATQDKMAFTKEPNAFFRDTVVAKILVQALNNFKSSSPVSCAEALASYILTS